MLILKVAHMSGFGKNLRKIVLAVFIIIFLDVILIFVLYNFVFSALSIRTPLGVIFGVVVAAAIVFYYVKRVAGLTAAIITTLMVILLVLFLGIFLIANVLGE